MLWRSHLLFALGLSLCATGALACTASLQGEQSPGGPGRAGGAGSSAGANAGQAGAGAPGGAPEAGTTSRFLRLTRVQWENAAHDVLRLEALPGSSENFTTDAPDGRFDTDQRRRVVTPPLVEDYRIAAEALAQQLATSPARRDAIGAGSAALLAAGGVEAWLGAWLLRAYRRPPTELERATYLSLYQQAASLFPDDAPDSAGVRLVVSATLQSPHFLYLVERSAAGASLTDYELASRLALGLTQAPPTDELLAKAAQGGLADPAQLSQLAQGLLATPRGAAMLQDFHRQMLRMQEYAFIQGDPARPDDAATIAPQLLRDGLAFVGQVVGVEDGGLRALLTHSQVFAGAATAALYGSFSAPAETPQPFMPKAGERRGFLTTAGFLAAYSHGLTPDSIHRGLFINLQLLCREIPPPPVDVPALPADLPGTNRQRLERFTGLGTCGASCHATIINPPGFAFENYDGLGRYRTQEPAGPIDASGSVDLGAGPVSFKDGVELSSLIAESPLAHACYSRRWAEFLMARDVSAHQPALLEALGQASLSEDSSARALVARIVTSDAFRRREQGVLP